MVDLRVLGLRCAPRPVAGNGGRRGNRATRSGAGREV